MVAQVNGLIAVDMDSEKVMLNIDTGKYFALDQIGRHIWELIESPCCVSKITEVLVEQYEVDQVTCQSDVLAFLETLSNKGLVELV